MVGVDHTSGTDTKVETDTPQPPDDAYEPPPDRPGSPGQASRRESKAAAQTPTETADERRDDDPPADETGPSTELQVEDLPEETEAPATAAERSAESADQHDTEATDGEPSDQDSDNTEPEQPAEWPDVPLGPRAESRARARETPQAAPESDTEQPETADREPQLLDDAEIDPGLAEADGNPDPERPDDRTHDASEDDEDIPAPGNQPESPAPEENKADQFAGLPTRADLDPATAGELTAERGESLPPINENQDLTEPDPEDDSLFRRMLRENRTEADDALGSADNLTADALKFLEQKPPIGHPTTVRDTAPHMEAPQVQSNYVSALVGVVAGGIVAVEAGRKIVRGAKRVMGRSNGDN